MHTRIGPTRNVQRTNSKGGMFLAAVLFYVAVGSFATTTNGSDPKVPRQNFSPSPAATAATEDKGDFILQFHNIKDKKNLGHLEKTIKDSKLFEGIVKDLNDTLALPVDVPLRFMECGLLPDTKETGVENAWYNPDDNGIVMCYELIAKTENLFRDDEPSAEELEGAVLGSTAWTIYHEVGHALVDIYKVPITGKEEDAVDQLSTYILLTGGDAGEMAALDGAVAFLKEQEADDDVDEMALADSHSLSVQRFFNIICWIYGQNEEKFAEIAKGKNAVLPENRADKCQGEFEQIERSWTTLLAPHMKKPAAPSKGGK